MPNGNNNSGYSEDSVFGGADVRETLPEDVNTLDPFGTSEQGLPVYVAAPPAFLAGTADLFTDIFPDSPVATDPTFWDSNVLEFLDTSSSTSPSGIAFEQGSWALGALLSFGEFEASTVQKRIERKEEEAAAAAAKEEELTEEEKSAKNRFAEQCYLAWNLPQLAGYHKASMMPPYMRDLSKQNDLYYGYKKTHILDGDGATVIPKLKMRPGTEKLLDATTHELSELVPKLNLYKIVYVGGSAVDEIPFKFYDHTITAAEAQSDWGSGDASVFTNTAGRGGIQGRTGVGIKSFDWQLNATDPDTVRNDITAKLVLSFQSMDELVRKRKANVIREGKSVEVLHSYLDLIVHPPVRGAKGKIDQENSDQEPPDLVSSLEFDSSYFEIKALLGWSKIETGETTLSAATSESVIYNQIPMFLSLETHEFSINEDGTFLLTINYRGRLDGTLVSPKSNILMSGGAVYSGDDLRIHRDIRDYQKDIESIRTNSDIMEGVFGGPLQEGDDEQNTEQIKVLKEKILKAKNTLRERTYEMILTTLLRPWEVYEDIAENKHSLIYSLPITPETIGRFADSGILPASKDSITSEQIRRGEVPTTAVKEHVQDPEPYKNPWETPRKFGWEYKQYYSEETSEDLTGYDAIEQWDPNNPSTHYLNYFYLGDLIDIIAYYVFGNTKDAPHYGPEDDELKRKYAFNKAETTRLRLLLGPFEFIDPQTGQKQTISIADIPI